MKSFIDANIALGYSLICDKWHENIIEFFSKNDEIYWSNNVCKEFNEKYEFIFNEINSFLKRISSLLNSNDTCFINYYEFERFILRKTKNCKLDMTKKVKITEFFWNNKIIYCNPLPTDILIEFNHFLANYTYNHDLRKKELESMIKLHDCGLDNYLNYTHLLEKLKSLNVHDPDFKIILDAHDLGLTADVRFVTTDYKLYNTLKKCDFLKIKEFKSCNN